MVAATDGVIDGQANQTAKCSSGTWPRRGLFVIWGVEIAASCLFEVIGTGTNVYTYYGPYVGRIWNYPFVIGVLEGARVVLFTVVAVLLWCKVSTN